MTEPLIPSDVGTDVEPSISIGDDTLRRSELLQAAAATAAHIRGANTVAVHATPSMETAVATLGCLLAGVPAVPVPPDAGLTERAHIINDSGAELWLGNPPDDLAIESITVEIGDRSNPSGAAIPEDHTALVMYTSGTTGPPKGAVISRRAVAACLDGLADAWDWTPDDVLVHGLPLFHVHGLVLGVLGALRVGSHLVHTGRPAPEAYARAVAERGGTLLFGVPTVWSRIAADATSARALGAARLLVSGSAPLPVPVADQLAERTGLVPVERYGMTETLITLAQRADRPRRPGWVGPTLSGVETRLVDEAGVLVPRDGETSGELLVRGATLFDGYRGRPAAIDADGWFATGDIAAIDGSGEHRIVGRAATDLIKSGGYRIGAGEVEAALLGHPSVAEVAVVGVPDDDLGQRVVAYVVTEAGQKGDEPTLIAHVAEAIAAHKRPREVRFVSSLPRNAMGKVRKRDLMTD